MPKRVSTNSVSSKSGTSGMWAGDTTYGERWLVLTARTVLPSGNNSLTVLSSVSIRANHSAEFPGATINTLCASTPPLGDQAFYNTAKLRVEVPHCSSKCFGPLVLGKRWGALRKCKCRQCFRARKATVALECAYERVHAHGDSCMTNNRRISQYRDFSKLSRDRAHKRPLRCALESVDDRCRGRTKCMK